jgi:ectonucleotide pyrophosphatase/phosphodiesterase family member 5
VIERRTFLTAGAAGLVGALGLGLGAGTASAASGDLRVVVMVVDGCRPDESTGPFMPTFTRLGAAGLRATAARAIPVAETIPNHVAMMTGVLPRRSGVPANAIYDRAEGTTRDLDRPTDLRAPTLLDRLRTEQGRVTASVLSKGYLYGIFRGRATHHWEPQPRVPVTDHAPDAITMTTAIDYVDRYDPALTFVNLGDVDRTGHADLTGTTVQVARRAALVSTDTELARFESFLRTTGRWERTVWILLADHSMDFSVPTNLIGLRARFDADPTLAGKVQVSQNGGADLAYWTGPSSGRTAAVARMRAIATATPGVESVFTPGDLGLGPEAGDLVALCRQGWRFSDPTPVSNPIPGNHGHAVTYPIPLVVSGGRPGLPQGRTTNAAVRTLDVAPAVAALFGLRPPAGGWDTGAALRI